jgi:outer membrane lipoprotein LolB
MGPTARNQWSWLFRPIALGSASLVCALLAACAGPGPGRQDACESNGPACAAIGASFAIEGRISVKYGDQSLSGKFDWSHSQERDELNLATPLGTQVAQIVRDGAGVLLTNSRQEQYRAPDVESLTERQLGWRLPLVGLADWVRGRAQEGATAQARRGENGRLAELRESDWVIEYSYGDPPNLPRRLILNYTKAGKPLEIRLVIDTWSAPK